MAGKNDLLFDKPTLVNGGQSKDAVVVTSPDKQHVNAPTVEDIQKIAKGIAEKEAEAASATEWEKSVKDKVYYDADEEELFFETPYGYEFTITDTNTHFGFKLGDNDELVFDFSYLQLGRDDFSRIYIDTDENTMRVPFFIADDIYNIDKSGSVNTTDLLDGNRIYKHKITIEDTTNKYLFAFEFYNSSPDEIDDFDTISYDTNFEFCVGVFVNKNTNPYTRKIGILNVVYQGEITIMFNDGSEHTFTEGDVSDTITQC